MAHSSGYVRDHCGPASGQAKAGDLVVAAAGKALLLAVIYSVLACAQKGHFLAGQREGCALHSSGHLQNYCAPAALEAKAGGPTATTILHCIDGGLGNLVVSMFR